MTMFHHVCVFPNWYLQGNVRQLIFETFCEKYPSTSGGCLNPPKFRTLSNQSRHVVSHLRKPMDFWSTQVSMLIHVDTSGVFDVESWNVTVVNVFLVFNSCKVPRHSSKNSSPNFNPRSVCWWVLWAWKCPPKYSGAFKNGKWWQGCSRKLVTSW